MIFGSGILRGMVVTIKNMIASYFMPADKGGLFTVEYPEKRIPISEYFRNFPFLVYDEKVEEPRCVACEICAKECPTKCITLTRTLDHNGKPLRKPDRFDIDLTICMSCGICEEVCPFDSIFMGHDFEIAKHDRQTALFYHKEDLLKPNTYFQTVRPTDAAAIDQKRRNAAEKKKAAQARQQPNPPENQQTQGQE